MNHRDRFFTTLTALVVLGSLAGAPGIARGESATALQTISLMLLDT